MFRLFLSILSLAGCSITSCLPAQGQTTSQMLRFEEVDREYLLHLPDGWDGVSPLPLFVGLHGGSGSNTSYATTNLFLEAADRHGFLAVFPNAVNGVWNDGRDRNPPAVKAINDVGFVAALIDEVVGELPVDLDRIYASGTSNGGMLTHRLALEMGYTPGGNRLAGFAPVVANLPLDLLPAEPNLPLHGVMIVGTADPLMPFIGGQVSGDKGRVLSSDNSRDVWRAKLGLSETGFSEVDFDDVSPDDGVVRAEFYESESGPDFAYYVVEGGGHAVPGSTSVIPDLAGFGPTNRDIVGADEILSFFVDRSAIPSPFLPGDFSGDGVVDAADYTIWRDSLGDVGIGLAADHDASGAVDLGDYEVWRSNFGADAAPQVAIAAPEPATSSFLLVTTLIALVSRSEGRVRPAGQAVSC